MKLSRFAAIIEDNSPYKLLRIMHLGRVITAMLEARDEKGLLKQVSIAVSDHELRDCGYPEEIIRLRTLNAVEQMRRALEPLKPPAPREQRSA